MNVMMITLRDWAFRNLRARPVKAAMAVAVVTAVSALSYAIWLPDLLFATGP